MDHRDFVIKQVDENDFLTLSDFFERNNVSHITSYFNPFPLNSETAYHISRNLKLDKYYVAYREKTVIAFFMLRGWDDNYDIPSFGILVDRDFHHQGIGRLLSNYAIGEAKRLGCTSIRLSVYASNSNAVNLYTSLGFFVVTRQPIFLLDHPDEKIVMIKEL